MVREALEDVGVPAVINGAGSVFGTEPAREWLRLLEALERPASITRAHSAALTAFLGWPAERLAAADEDSWAWEEVHRRLHEWARVLRVRGVASLLETVMRQGPTGGEAAGVGGHEFKLAARVLGQAAGERSLTDLRHIGQLLHTAASAEQLGPTALTAWLRTRIAEADDDTADEERSRPLESDARPCRCSRSTAARAGVSVVYLPCCVSRAPSPPSRRGRCYSTTPGPGTSARSTSLWRAPTTPATASSSSASSAARICGSPTWRSHARVIRPWCGGPV